MFISWRVQMSELNWIELKRSMSDYIGYVFSNFIFFCLFFILFRFLELQTHALQSNSISTLMSFQHNCGQPSSFLNLHNLHFQWWWIFFIKWIHIFNFVISGLKLHETRQVQIPEWTELSDCSLSWLHNREISSSLLTSFR